MHENQAGGWVPGLGEMFFLWVKGLAELSGLSFAYEMAPFASAIPNNSPRRKGTCVVGMFAHVQFCKKG